MAAAFFWLQCWAGTERFAAEGTTILANRGGQSLMRVQTARSITRWRHGTTSRARLLVSPLSVSRITWAKSYPDFTSNIRRPMQRQRDRLTSPLVLNSFQHISSRILHKHTRCPRVSLLRPGIAHPAHKPRPAHISFADNLARREHNVIGTQRTRLPVIPTRS